MYEHKDSYAGLHGSYSMNEKLRIIHRAVQQKFPFVDRIAVALCDSQTSVLKTYVASGSERPLVRYECRLEEAPSLQEILRTGHPRVVNDLDIFSAGNHEHTKRIRDQGYGSSFTVPIIFQDRFLGFLFFNSYLKNCFTEEVLEDLDPVAHLVSSLVAHEVSSIRIMLAALKTASEMVHRRDPETGAHLERMSRFARLIAQYLAETGQYSFNDEYIERIFIFSPLHDVGKIGIPDRVLLKPTKLDEVEFELMKTHTTIGANIIDSIVDNFGLQAFEGIDVLRNIAKFHHEKTDGSGYPLGLKRDEIPPEAMIVAVADIFDALTSVRPYKKAWSNEEAFDILLKLACTELDHACVDALVQLETRVREIQSQFVELPEDPVMLR